MVRARNSGTDALWSANPPHAVDQRGAAAAPPLVPACARRRARRRTRALCNSAQPVNAATTTPAMKAPSPVATMPAVISKLMNILRRLRDRSAGPGVIRYGYPERRSAAAVTNGRARTTSRDCSSIA
jgi:hypothetical protein